jgi:hypothetical protein
MVIFRRLLLIAAIAIVWTLLGARRSIPCKPALFSSHLVIDPEQPFFGGLLRGGRLVSSEQAEDHAAADNGQASDNQCDA